MPIQVLAQCFIDIFGEGKKQFLKFRFIKSLQNWSQCSLLEQLQWWWIHAGPKKTLPFVDSGTCFKFLLSPGPRTELQPQMWPPQYKIMILFPALFWILCIYWMNWLFGQPCQGVYWYWIYNFFYIFSTWMYIKTYVPYFVFMCFGNQKNFIVNPIIFWERDFLPV